MHNHCCQSWHNPSKAQLPEAIVGVPWVDDPITVAVCARVNVLWVESGRDLLECEVEHLGGMHEMN